MVMEAFEGFENRVRYDIVGHSGETKSIQFVNEKRPPADSKMRLETIKVGGFIKYIHFFFFSKKSQNFILYFVCFAVDDACTFSILLVGR